MRRPETVLIGTQQPENLLALGFKIEHGVHHVLEHARAGDIPFFGDVPQNKDGDAARFGQTQEFRGAFPHLADRPGSAGHIFPVGRSGWNR